MGHHLECRSGTSQSRIDCACHIQYHIDEQGPKDRQIPKQDKLDRQRCQMQEKLTVSKSIVKDCLLLPMEIGPVQSVPPPFDLSGSDAVLAARLAPEGKDDLAEEAAEAELEPDIIDGRDEAEARCMPDMDGAAAEDETDDVASSSSSSSSSESSIISSVGTASSLSVDGVSS